MGGIGGMGGMGGMGMPGMGGMGMGGVGHMVGAGGPRGMGMGASVLGQSNNTRTSLLTNQSPISHSRSDDNAPPTTIHGTAPSDVRW
jgi:hypothetical protein